MMKKLWIYSQLLVFALIASSQSYYDALDIKALPGGVLDPRTNKYSFTIKKEDLRSIEAMMRNYGLKGEYSSDAELFAAISKLFTDSNNPFLIAKASGQDGGLDSKSLTGSTENDKSTSKIGGLNVTNIADGLARFLVERTKQELSIAFFQNFKKVIAANPDFKELFPKTEAVIQVVDKDIYQFSNYLNTLREAFEDDMENILTQLEPYLKNKQGVLAAADPNAAKKIDYFVSAIIIVNNIKNGVHPAKAIGKITTQNITDGNLPLENLQEALKLFNIFSNSLVSRQSDRFWIEPDSLNLLMNQSTFRIYLGLLYEKHGSDKIFGNQFKSYLDKVAAGFNTGAAEFDKYQEFLIQILNHAENIELIINGIKEKKRAGEKIDSYSEVFETTLNLLKKLDDLKDLDPAFNISSLTSITRVMELVNDLYIDVNERKFNALILDLSKFLTEVLGNKYTWDDDLIKYGSFIANVAQAESADQVQAAIEAVALPVGSASIKRKTKTNIALNAFVGLSPGLDFNGDEGYENPRLNFGMASPIGVAFSHGQNYEKSNGKFKKSSGSFFISLIDIGALTSYRFSHDSEDIPELTLSNIFAPGIYHVWGFANNPVSVGLGGQLGPEVRSLESGVVSENDGPNFMIRLFVAVDIPLFNFYTKNK